MPQGTIFRPGFPIFPPPGRAWRIGNLPLRNAAPGDRLHGVRFPAFLKGRIMSATTTRPDLAKLSARLAANNARVDAFLNSLPSRIDRLVEAALAGDWDQVRQVSEFIALSGAACDCPELAAKAEVVANEAKQATDSTTLRRGVLRLICECGRARPK